MGSVYAVPRLPRSIVRRPRISSMLDQGSPLVVVRGVAGAGKTTALADWAEGTQQSGVWVTLDPATGERAVFWDAVLHQLDDAGLLPDEGVLRDVLGAVHSQAEIQRMLVRGFTQLTHDIVLIVDNLQHAQQSVVEDIVAVLTACRRIRVVVATRGRSILEQEGLTVALDPTVVGTRELMFTPDETRELVRILELPDDAGTVTETVWAVSGGLPLIARGVLVVASRGSFELTTETIRQHITTVGGDALAEVWGMQHQQDPEVDAVLRMSIAEVLTPDLVAALTGVDDADALLATVENAGLGWWTPSDGRAHFTLSTEIRDGMRRELQRRFPDELVQLRRAVMRWSLENGREIDAFQHGLGLGDYAFVNEVLLRAYWVLLPHRDLVIAELGAIPRRTLSRQPLLAMLYALSLNADGARVRALEAFAMAIVSARAASSSVEPAHRVVLATIESAALRVMGRFSLSLKAAQRSASLLAQLTPEQRDALRPLQGSVLTHTGLSFFYAGEREQAHDFFLAAQESSHPLARLQGVSLTAGSYALQGHMPEAQKTIELCESEPWPARQLEGYPGAFYQLASGLLALERGDYEGALAHVDIMSPHLETIEHWPVLMYLKSLAHMGMGRALPGAVELEMALHRGARPSVAEGTRTLLDMALADLSMAAGQIPRAEAALARHAANSPVLVASRARLQLILGNADAAERLLRGTLPNTPRQLAEQLLLLAATKLRLGRVDEAIIAAQRGLALLHDRGLTTPFRLLPATDAAALAELVDTAERLASLRPFVRELRASPTFMPDAARTVQLTERELVVLQRLAGSASLSEVAAELYVSLNTVKSQVKSIYKKLGVSSREHAVAEAGRLHLLDA